MKKAPLKLPQLISKKVWVGFYFNHYNAVVFFSEKPKASKEPHQHIDGDWYDLLDNQKIVVGTLFLEDFVELFPTVNLSSYLNEHGNAPEIEPSTLFQLDIEWFWDDHGKMRSFDFNIDGYVE